MNEKTVLVCDDEPHIVHVVSAKLSNAGYQVITAEDGEEALERAASLRPDLIVTDYQMPVLSGLDLCLRLRERPETAHIPVILLTARGFTIHERDRDGTRIRAVLPKPFSPREVLQTVQRILADVGERNGTVPAGNVPAGAEQASWEGSNGP